MHRIMLSVWFRPAYVEQRCLLNTRHARSDVPVAAGPSQSRFQWPDGKAAAPRRPSLAPRPPANASRAPTRDAAARLVCVGDAEDEPLCCDSVCWLHPRREVELWSVEGGSYLLESKRLATGCAAACHCQFTM